MRRRTISGRRTSRRIGIRGSRNGERCLAAISKVVRKRYYDCVAGLVLLCVFFSPGSLRGEVFEKAMDASKFLCVGRIRSECLPVT